MHRSITDRLLQDHQHIGSVLTLMRVQLDILGPKDSAGLTLLSNATNYLIHYPGLLHHPLEESLFASMGDKSTAVTSRIHGRLQQEHGELATSASDLVARIGLHQLGAEPEFAGLRDSGVAYILDYADHIRFEEEEVIPLALKTLSAQQWLDIRTTTDWHTDPLFNRRTLSLYDNLYDALMNGADERKH